MCGKSCMPSEHILEKIKPNNSLFFLREIGRGDNFIFVKILFCRINSRIFYF